MKSITLDDALYPPLLREIQNPPKEFFIVGDLPDTHQPWIAIVGTRKASEAGITLARNLAKELASCGAVIVSGLAMGIDTAAHQGALIAGGKTVAVLPSSINEIYPAQNINLAKKILTEGGAMISEYPGGTPTYKGNFIARNRIIAGLGMATIVIEAPDRSGSLATARFAGESGREVLVFPGNIKDVNFKGSHKLIRDGAILVTSLEDILDDLGLTALQKPLEKKKLAKDLKALEPTHKLIYQALADNYGVASVDKILEMTNLEPQVLSSALSIMSLKRIIKETDTGYTI